jgi:hypothetical protein
LDFRDVGLDFDFFVAGFAFEVGFLRAAMDQNLQTQDNAPTASRSKFVCFDQGPEMWSRGFAPRHLRRRFEPVPFVNISFITIFRPNQKAD